MRELQSEVIGDRRVRLVVDESERYAVTRCGGLTAGKISACKATRICRCIAPACATGCAEPSNRHERLYGIRSKARLRRRSLARRGP